MKSRIKFDLDENNQEVIKAHVVKGTDDVRDRIAAGFKDKVGTSSFCMIHFGPYPNDWPANESLFEISPIDLYNGGLDKLEQSHGIQFVRDLRDLLVKWCDEAYQKEMADTKSRFLQDKY